MKKIYSLLLGIFLLILFTKPAHAMGVITPIFMDNYHYARLLYGFYLSSIIVGILFSRKFITTRIYFFLIPIIPIITILWYGIPNYLLYHPNTDLLYLFIFFPLVLYPFLIIISFITSAISIRLDNVKKLQALIHSKGISSKFLLVLTIYLFFNIVSWLYTDYIQNYAYLVDKRYFNVQYMQSIIVFFLLISILIYQIIIRKSSATIKNILQYKKTDYWYAAIYILVLLLIFWLFGSNGMNFSRLFIPV